MKPNIIKYLSFAYVITMIIYVLCFGFDVSTAAQTTGQNMIRINVDRDTFNSFQKIYCLIYDETTDENVSSRINDNAEMTQEGDTDIWSYDLDVHEITLDSTHTYREFRHFKIKRV